jgi:hypothetical protein
VQAPLAFITKAWPAHTVLPEEVLTLTFGMATVLTLPMALPEQEPLLPLTV